MSTNSSTVILPNDPPSVDPTRQEFMTSCMSDGTDEEKCTAMWTASHQVNPEVPPPEIASGDDPDLLLENQMLKAQVKLREDQVLKLMGVADRYNDERKAKNQAEKLGLIKSIQIDGKFDNKALHKKTLPELRTMRYTLDCSLPKRYANIGADIQSNQKKKNLYTAGYFDSATKTWKGGVN